MRRTLVVALAFIFLAASAAWAQYTDALLGPHNIGENGCLSCHAPHNAQPGQGLYLWGMSIPTGVYNTYLTSDGNGGTVQMTNGAGGAFAGVVAQYDTSEHTILCMSCHDTTFSGMGATIPNGAGLAWGSDYAIGAGQDLTSEHPVHVAYPSQNTYWEITPGTDVYGNPTFNFVDATTFGTTYGHGARLFPSSATTANIECASCHNPHAWQNAVVNRNGTLAAVATDHFLRGGFDQGTVGAMTIGSNVTDTGTSTNFCLSCHAYMAQAFSSSGYVGN